MRFNKLFLFGAILISLIVTAQFANAGLSDLFKKKTADLSPTPVTATLTVNTPPFVAKIFEAPTIFGFPAEPIQPQAGAGTVTAYKAFVIEDLDSINDIPASPSVLVNFVGGLKSPTGLTPVPIPAQLQIPFTSCIAATCSFLPGTCPGNPQKSMIWACATDQTFPSWYPPSQGTTNPALLWQDGLQVRDATTNIWGNFWFSGDTPALGILPGSYHQVSGISGYTATGSPTWQSLPVTATNQISSQDIVLTQQGNLPLQTSIAGTPLVGNAGPTSFIIETAFKMGAGPSVCTTGLTLSTINQQITSAILPQTYSGLGVDTLTLSTCVAHSGPLSASQQGPPSDTYSNAANPWTLDAT